MVPGSPGPPESLPTLAPRREAAISIICEGFAHDYLTMDELERRLEAANRAATISELDALIADLPAPVDAGGRTASAGAAAGPARTPVVATHERAEQTLIAIMGGTERRGVWTPARKTFVVAVMGGAVLDFREARLPAGVTEVAIFSVMGGAQVIVPPGMRVETEGFALMGGFAQSDPGSGHADTSASTLRISGFALMGGVDLETRYPGEGEREARKRRREERRRR